LKCSCTCIERLNYCNILEKKIEIHPLVASDTECGLGTVGRQQKIVGGTEASRGEFPFIVSLRHSAKDRHFCGGAILDRTHILTAAHCVDR
jgi:secreted trypsin-like serine protease